MTNTKIHSEKKSPQPKQESEYNMWSNNHQAPLKMNGHCRFLFEYLFYLKFYF